MRAESKDATRRSDGYLALICLYFLFFSTGISAKESIAVFDWQVFESVLKDHVTSKRNFGIRTRVVDYQALLEDQDFLNINSQLKNYDPSGLDRLQRLAFYINAYNYYAIKIVVDNWPVESIRDIGTFFSPVWKKTAGSINHQNVTLDQIEHAILRPMGEPRIHFAIVCSSNSCPDIRLEIYSADQLNRQLTDQVKSFIANKGKGVCIVDGELHVSSIFKWFEEDFDNSGGVIAFISKHAPRYSKFSSFDTLRYDWRLNDTSGNDR
jgi:hypothetical protein